MWTHVASSILCAPALLLAFALDANGQSTRVKASPSSLPGRVVNVRAAEFAFRAPDTIPAGLTTFRLLQTGMVVERMPPVATSNSPTRGRVKLPHLEWRDGGTLSDLRTRRNSRCGLLQSPALPFKLQQMPVV